MLGMALQHAAWCKRMKLALAWFLDHNVNFRIVSPLHAAAAANCTGLVSRQIRHHTRNG
jgi:hypothetical protein